MRTQKKTENGAQIELQRLRTRIAELEQSERKLRRAQNILQRITDNMTDLIAETNGKGIFRYISPSLKSILGYDPKSLIGTSVKKLDFIHPDDLQDILSQVTKITSGHQRIQTDLWQQECRLRHADGHYIWVEGLTRLIRDSENRITATVTVGRDISNRKQMEEGLRESEEHLKSIVENLGEGVVIIDDDENFIFSNPAADTIFGVPLGTLAGSNLSQFTAPGQLSIFSQPQINAGLHREKNYHEIEITRPDGEIRHLIVTTTPRKKGKKFVGAYGLFRDITERKLVEKALLESEDRYRHIFETAGVSIWEEDFSIVKIKFEELKAKGISGIRDYLHKHPEFLKEVAGLIQILDVNRATLNMFGAKNKRQLLGSLNKIIVPETQEILLEELLAIAEGKTYFEGETINKTLQGDTLNIWLTMSLPAEIEKYNSVLVSMMDITARKQAEYETNLQRTRFQQLFENAPVAIALIDSESKIQKVNSSFESIFDYQSEEIVGCSIQDVIVPKNLRDESIKLSDTTLSGRTVQKETIRHRKDGTPVPVNIIGVPIILDDNPVAIFAMYEDISDRKHKEEKLEYLSTHDALTGLYNRAYFEHALARLQANKEYPVSIMVGDIDDLKQTNDTLGHVAGDRLLIHAAHVLKSALRSNDVIARLGGDEFVVILPKTDHLAAKKTLNRIKEKIQELNLENPSTPLNFSFGVATSSKRCSLAKVLQEADRHMYLEKSNKKVRQMKDKAGKEI